MLPRAVSDCVRDEVESVRRRVTADLEGVWIAIVGLMEDINVERSAEQSRASTHNAAAGKRRER
jgi:hypothetical protein